MLKALSGRFKKRVKVASAIFALLFVLWFFCLPSVIFHQPYSTVLLDKDGGLLSASIASDGQWRFPETAEVPEKFKTAITIFEDKRFYHHPGVDPLALARSIRQNISAGSVVSGGSTLTMQVMRLSKDHPSRNVFNKVLEMIQATRLEWRYSKNEIMAMYAAHAPFGGNVVGIEAACWRYFGRQPDELSWAEAATLAVLPNQPSAIHPGKRRAVLKEKRDRLLARMHAAGLMDDVAYDLSLAEPVPELPLALPRMASHLLHRAIAEGRGGQRIHTSIDLNVQQRVQTILDDHHQRLKGNQIFNAAALVLDVNSGDVLAYVGNVQAGSTHDEQVDIITSRRSTGSILKPFLYAAMLNEGKMLPKTLVSDIPTIINGFAPKNFSKNFDGAVPADKALIRSLNIPAVHELRDFRYEKFYNLLKGVGLTTLDQPADHYGLSMILGGADATLWDVTGAYASMARTLNHYFTLPGSRRYRASTYHPPRYVNEQKDQITNTTPEESGLLDAGSLWLTFNALKEVYRPGEETGWRNFYSSKQIAWKTGTSFGFRDGWAVGVTPQYAIGIWIGNADGEGRPGLTGTDAAAPVLFDVFSFLPGRDWFERPTSDLHQLKVCSVSGQIASEWCDEAELMDVPARGDLTKPCLYHRSVHLSADGRYRVHSECESLNRMQTVNWFILPPIQEYYYRLQHLSYKSLPPFKKDCIDPSVIAGMDIIYPRTESKIFVPRQLDGTPGNTVFQVAHRNPRAVIYWHLDGAFIGATSNTHKLPFSPAEGHHTITLVDDTGETLQRTFDVVSSR